MEDKQFGMLMDMMQSIQNNIFCINDRLDKIENRLDKVEARLDNIEIRLDKVETRLDKIEARLDKLENKTDEHDKKFILLMGEVTFIKDDICQIKGEMKILNNRVDKLEERIEINNNQHATMINLLEKRYNECKKDRMAIHKLLELNKKQHKIYSKILNLE